MVRAWGWFRIVFGVLAMAVGLLFLVGLTVTWFQARAEMPQYQSARECAQQIPACYQTLPGTVIGTTYESTNSGTSGSITVRTSRGTEDIAVSDINVSRDGVHTGDQVSVRYWQSKARLLIIHEDNFPTVDDPASELSSTPPGLFLGGLITAVGAVSLGTGIRTLRRQRKLVQIRPESRQTGRAVPYVGPAASERDPQTLVLRPSRRNLRAPWLVAAVFAIALLGKAALDLSSAMRGRGWAAVAVDSALILAIGIGLPALLFSFYRTSRVLIGTHAVTLTGLGGKSCDRAAVTRIVQVSNQTSGSVPIPMALLVDRDDRVLLRVSSGFDIATLGRQLGVPVEGSWEAEPADELAQRYPGSVSPLTVNAGALGVALALVITVVVVIAVFIFHVGVNYSH